MNYDIARDRLVELGFVIKSYPKQKLINVFDTKGIIHSYYPEKDKIGFHLGSYDYFTLWYENKPFNQIVSALMNPEGIREAVLEKKNGHKS